MNRAQIGIVIGSVTACAAMCLYPPYQDWAVVLPEPMYAPIWRPPLGGNAGQSIAILWPVLACQWGIVLLLSAGLFLTLSNRLRWNAAQWCALWVGIGLGVAMLLYPPYQGWGVKYKFLFAPEEGISLRFGDLLVQLMAVGLVTLGVLRVKSSAN
jgi:hypothetical protein